MKTITTGQQTYVANLAAQRDAAGFDPILVARLDEARIGTLPMREVDGLLATLKSIPRTPLAPTAMPEPGYYATPTRFVCVVKTKDGQRVYAKTLEFHTGEDGAQRPSWDYAPRVAATLAGASPLTAEQVKEFGYAHGFCMKCCRPLTDAASVERGAGPVCWKKLVGSGALAAA